MQNKISMETVICQAENRFSFDELPLDFALSRYEEFDNECWLEIMQMIKKLSKVINAKIPILYKKLMLNKTVSKQYQQIQIPYV